MRLLVLGGTRFLGRHVATAALERGHEVATFTRGLSGQPPEGVRALHGDRDDPAALPKALDGWRPELVVDTSCQTRVAADNAAAALDDLSGYAFVSSLNAYSGWPPGPIGREDDEPTWDTTDDEYGPNKAYAERTLAAAFGNRFLTARAGLIIGPYDPIYRLGWWLDRISRGGRGVVPDALDQPMAMVDARDLAAWLVGMAEQERSGAGNATGPAGGANLRGGGGPCPGGPRGGPRGGAGGDDDFGGSARPGPRGHRQRRGVGAGVRGGAGGRERAAGGAPAVLAARRGRRHRLGRRHHPGPGAGPAQSPAAELDRGHL